MDKDKKETNIPNSGIENIDEVLLVLFKRIKARGPRNYRRIFTVLVNDVLELKPRKSYNTIAKTWFVTGNHPEYLTSEEKQRILAVMYDVLIEEKEDFTIALAELQNTLNIAEIWKRKFTAN